MKNALLVLGCFAVGILAGVAAGGVFPASQAALWVLYALMLLVGMSLGSDRQLKQILRSLRPWMVLLPVGTAVGSLLGAVAAGFLLKQWGWADYLAVGSGFGYYSLSSILITQLKEASLGAAAAAQLGTVALLSNMIREMFTLLFTPLLVKYFGRLAPICAGGVTSMDATLPVIAKYCGKDLVFLAVFHGVVLDISVPFFVSFFCSL